MPPSGYSVQQSGYLAAFLKSCAEALEQEAVQFSQSLVKRLQVEVLDIDRFLTEGGVSAAQRPVLELTKNFYERVAKWKPQTREAYWMAVENVLHEMRQSILAIHIEPTRIEGAAV